MKKRTILILMSVCLWLCACNDNKGQKFINAEFLDLMDTKPCTDSISETNVGFSNYNGRKIELRYVIHNYSSEDIDLPIESFFCERTDTAYTNIKVYFINGKDTIYPLCGIGRYHCNERVVNAGDSIRLKIEISHFQEWGNDDIGVNTDIRTLISKLHLEYCKNPNDVYENLETPIIKFDSIPKKYYEVPRGGTIEPYLGPLHKVEF